MKTITPAPTIEPPITPDNWHVKPDDGNAECSICGCPHMGHEEHHATEQPGLWQRRHLRNSSGGGKKRWDYLPVTKIRVRRSRTTVAASADHSRFADKPAGKVKGATDAPEVASYVNDLVNVASVDQVDLKAAVMRLADFLDKIYKPLRLRNRSGNTVRLYGATLTMFGKYLGRPPTLGDLNDETLAAFMSWRIDNGKSPHTANRDLNCLVALWRFAHRKRLVCHLPDIEPNVAPRRTPVAWTLDQTRHLYDVAGKTTGHICNIPAGEWWQALLSILWDTGERVGAVLALQWDSIDFTNQWVRFPAETRKGRAADKTFKLRPDSIEAIQRISEPARNTVFVWPYAQNYLWNRFAKILERADLPTDRRSKFHRIRRTVASYYKAAGGDATELLGHSRRSVTEAYIDPKITGPKQAVDLLPGLSEAEGGEA